MALTTVYALTCYTVIQPRSYLFSGAVFAPFMSERRPNRPVAAVHHGIVVSEHAPYDAIE